jgi:hypothetical protein
MNFSLKASFDKTIEDCQVKHKRLYSDVCLSFVRLLILRTKAKDEFDEGAEEEVQVISDEEVKEEVKEEVEQDSTHMHEQSERSQGSHEVNEGKAEQKHEMCK